MKKSSKTDWNKLPAMSDQDIDTTDIPELDASFFKNAELHTPVKKPVTIRLDADVLEWFKGQDQVYQTRINKLLRSYMEAHHESLNHTSACQQSCRQATPQRN